MSDDSGGLRPASPSAAPGAGLLLAILAALVLPALLAAAAPQLPAVLRGYLPLLPLPLLELEVALLFALLVLPAFAAPSPDDSNAALTGLVRGTFLAAMLLPFLLAARLVAPASAGGILAGCALVAATAAGSASAAAAFGARGLALAVAVAALPGLIGFFDEALDLPLGWLAALCPFLAVPAAAHGEAAWTLGLLPGIGLLAASLILGRRSRTCPPAENG